MGIINKNAQSLMISALRNDINSSSSLKLFRNDFTPDENSSTFSFTEANFPGYASKNLAGLWPAASLNGADAYETSVTAQVFTCAGGGSAQTIYGYYITSSSGFAMVTAHRFATPIVMENDGDAIAVTPRITLDEV